MRVEILIDPETTEYQIDLDGDLNTIRAVLMSVVKQLKDPEVIEQGPRYHRNLLLLFYIQGCYIFQCSTLYHMLHKF